MLPTALAALVLLILSAAAFFALKRTDAYKRARAQADRMRNCGELADPPSDEAHAQMKRVAGFFVRNFVGSVETEGLEKLRAAEGPLILVSNHGGLFDVAIAPLLLGKRKARFPAASGVMMGLNGWLGYLFSRWGVFAVDLTNGKSAYKSSVKVLTDGGDANIIAIFPEAQTNMDGVVGPFKTGAVRMAAEAGEKLGAPVPIYPIYIRYGRYPGNWITRLSFLNQWLVALFGACYYGRGARVVIGDPILRSDLPVDHREATEKLREIVMALDPKKV